MDQVLSQQAQRGNGQRELQVATGLALTDVQNARVPVDGVQTQWRDLGRPQAVVGQEMEDAEVPPTGLTASIDGSEQPAHC